MNAQMIDQLFVESYMMLNMEITFAGVRNWFQMGNIEKTDVSLFKALLFPEQMDLETKAEFARMVVYRYEDVFFQVNRSEDLDNVEIHRDVTEPIHQLLLRMMNVRSLRGSEDALIDLGVTLYNDKIKDKPIYTEIHGFFQLS